jgi:hypothetical protein
MVVVGFVAGVAQDGLRQSVQHRAAVGDACQPISAQLGHCAAERHRTPGDVGERVWKQLGVAGEQSDRDGFRAQTGAEGQQLSGSVVRCGQLFRRQSDGRAERHRVAGRGGTVGEAVRVSGGKVREVGLQQSDRLVAGKHVDVDRPRNPGPGRVPAGDHQLPRAVGQPRNQVVAFFGVVEQQQPARSATQMPAQRVDRDRGGRVRRHQPGLGGEVGEVITDQLWLLGRDPPDDVVLAGESVRVLESELGLADTAHAVKRLYGGPPILVEGVVEPVEHAVAAGERRISAPEVPHLRQ